MYIVVQTTLPDSMSIDLVKTWITESFSVVKNHNYGKQDFGKADFLMK
jgi:hypothetical protein